MRPTRPARPVRTAGPARPARHAGPGGLLRRGGPGLLVVAIVLGTLTGVGPATADPVGGNPNGPGDPVTASITVVQVAPGGADFTVTVAGGPDVVLDDDADPTLPDRTTRTGLAAGTDTVTQAAAAGWTLGALACDGATVVDRATRTATAWSVATSRSSHASSPARSVPSR